MTRPGPGSRLVGMGLASRLVLNNLLVILAGAGTVLVTALLVGPAVFEAHLQSVGLVPDQLVQEHVARAFDQSILVSLRYRSGKRSLRDKSVMGHDPRAGQSPDQVTEVGPDGPGRAAPDGQFNGKTPRSGSIASRVTPRPTRPAPS